MNTECFGHTVARLRKKIGLTQSELAAQLNVSNKTVSKWESGGGYPEITMLSPLSEALGVSVDYLLKGDMRGITIAGDILVDIVNILDKYPEKNMLAKVLSTTYAVGGCVPNTAINLAKIDSDVFVGAVAKIGNDENGRYLISQLKKYAIDTDGIKVEENGITASDLVMTDKRTGERTFFYTGGTNNTFDIDDIDISSLDCQIFHIGYILLLDALDSEDSEYQTRMARLLDTISKKGIKTSIDAVSVDSDRFIDKIVPVLKYCDYVILNEVESCRVSGLSPRNDDGSICIPNIRRTMEKFFEYGVREKVIVHCAEAGFLLDKNRGFFASGSLELPDDYIKGSVGAGDAYAAACLYGIYKGFEPMQMLEFAAAAAACNLSAADAVSGMKCRSEIELIAKNTKKRIINI